MTWIPIRRSITVVLAAFAALMVVLSVTMLPATAATVHNQSSAPTATQTSSGSTTATAGSSSLANGQSFLGDTKSSATGSLNPASPPATTTGHMRTQVNAGVVTSAKSKVTPPTPAPGVPPAPKFMFDSAAPGGIPASAQAVAGYVTGPYAWTPQQWAMFPHAQPITIDIVGGDKYAMVEDVEPGGVSVSVIRAWALERQAQHYTPVIYSAQSYYGAISQALAGLHWHWWAANPGGGPVPGAVATQVQWNGNSFDLSVLQMSPSDIIRS